MQNLIYEKKIFFYMDENCLRIREIPQIYFICLVEFRVITTF